MGRYQAIFRAEQRIIFPDGFGGYHVKPCGADLAGIQSVRQILFRHKLTTAVIDDNDAVLHFCDVIPVDDALRLREQRTVERYHIGA